MQSIRYALLFIITLCNLDCFAARSSMEEAGAPAHGGAGGSKSNGNVCIALETTVNNAISTIQSLAKQHPKPEDYAAQLAHQRRILQTLYEPEKTISAGQEVLRVRIYMGLYLCAAYIPSIRKSIPFVPAERNQWLKKAVEVVGFIEFGGKHKAWDVIRDNAIATDSYRIASASVMDKYGPKKL